MTFYHVQLFVMRNILCLYLNTGGGHKAPATVFKKIMAEAYPDANVILEDGFSSKNKLEKFLVEKLYQVSCNFVPGSWRIFFRITNFTLIQKFINLCFRPHTAWYMRRLIRRHKVTEVVSFHFMLTPSVKSAIRQVNKNIGLTVVVTDPFSCSTAWFLEKKVTFIVASETIKKFAVEKGGIDEKNIHVFPFLINKTFYDIPTQTQLKDLKSKHKIFEDKKVLLVTGGGGGLPNIVLIIQQLMRLKPNFTVIVVCGRDKASKKLLDVVSQLYPKIDLRIMGFISNMDEMIKVSDFAIIKPGASTIFEVLGAQKPVIISTYLHGQEFGNVEFVVQNRVGWFIRKPKDIAKFTYDILNDDERLLNVTKRLEVLPINKEITAVADFFYNKELPLRS